MVVGAILAAAGVPLAVVVVLGAFALLGGVVAANRASGGGLERVAGLVGRRPERDFERPWERSQEPPFADWGEETPGVTVLDDDDVEEYVDDLRQDRGPWFDERGEDAALASDFGSIVEEATERTGVLFEEEYGLEPAPTADETSDEGYDDSGAYEEEGYRYSTDLGRDYEQGDVYEEVLEEAVDEHSSDRAVPELEDIVSEDGLIDESKVTSDEAILTAAQATSMTRNLRAEESNAETREILSKVAALLAKYE